jgi:FkbM family methyltransferase
MIKALIRSYVGELSWKKLGEARQEFKIRNQKIHMDPEIYRAIGHLLPRRGYYADIGAHDGRSFSNTYHLEKDGWSGLLVEPILPTFFRLLQIRSVACNYFANAACVSFQNKSSNLLMSYGDLMSFAPEISSVSAEDWQNEAKQFLNRGEVVTETWVPARTLTFILEEAGSPKFIDFLSIDVEGAELDVISGIDFTTYKFGLICLETYNPESIIEFMKSFGYISKMYVANNLIFTKL